MEKLGRQKGIKKIPLKGIVFVIKNIVEGV